MKDPYQIDKQQIVRSFNHAAHSYHRATQLSEHVANNLRQQLPHLPNPHSVILEMGAGTGYFTKILRQYYPQARMVALDIAEQMLTTAKHFLQIDAAVAPSQLICSDIDNLPLIDTSVDMVVSNLTLQWCPQLEQTLMQCQRVLKPEGHFIFTTLGPQTLHELRDSWAKIDKHIHVNRFINEAQLKQNLSNCGFQRYTLTSHPVTFSYPTVDSLMRLLKDMGAHNINAGKPKGLTSKQKFQHLVQHYEAYRQDGALPASFEVFYVMAQK